MSLERNKKDLLSKLIVLQKALPMASSKLFKNLQAISYNSLILYFLFNFFIIELKLLGKSNLKYKSIKILIILSISILIISISPHEYYSTLSN